MNRLCILIFLSAIALGSCMEDTQPKPKELIAEDKYIDLIVELQLMRSYVESTNADSTTTDSLTKAVFREHDISSETFWTSHQYYQQFPTDQKNRIEKAIERLKMDQVSNTSEDSVSQNQ